MVSFSDVHAMAPTKCGIRNCAGQGVAKGPNRLQCDVRAHHEAFLVVTKSCGMDWEWTTRGRSHVKGDLVSSGGCAGVSLLGVGFGVKGCPSPVWPLALIGVPYEVLAATKWPSK